MQGAGSEGSPRLSRGTAGQAGRSEGQGEVAQACTGLEAQKQGDSERTPGRGSSEVQGAPPEGGTQVGSEGQVSGSVAKVWGRPVPERWQQECQMLATTSVFTKKRK